MKSVRRKDDAQMMCEALEILRKAEMAMQQIRTLLALLLECYHLHDSRQEVGTFYERVEDFEIMLINSALEQTRGSQIEAARLLGLNPTTIHGKIRKYKIVITDFKCQQ